MHRHGCVNVVHITKKVMMLIFSVNTLLAGSALPAHPISSYYRTLEVKLSDMVPPTARYPPVFYDSGHHGYCQQRPALLVNIIYSPEAASRRPRRRSACPASAVPVTDDRPPGLLAHPACGLMQSQFSAVGSRAFAAQESRPPASVALASSIAATESRQQATPPFACASEPRPVPPIAQTCQISLPPSLRVLPSNPSNTPAQPNASASVDASIATSVELPPLPPVCTAVCATVRASVPCTSCTQVTDLMSMRDELIIHTADELMIHTAVHTSSPTCFEKHIFMLVISIALTLIIHRSSCSCRASTHISGVKSLSHVSFFIILSIIITPCHAAPTLLDSGDRPQSYPLFTLLLSLVQFYRYDVVVAAFRAVATSLHHADVSLPNTSVTPPTTSEISTQTDFNLDIIVTPICDAETQCDLQLDDHMSLDPTTIGQHPATSRVNTSDLISPIIMSSTDDTDDTPDWITSAEQILAHIPKIDSVLDTAADASPATSRAAVVYVSPVTSRRAVVTSQPRVRHYAMDLAVASPSAVLHATQLAAPPVSPPVSPPVPPPVSSPPTASPPTALPLPAPPTAALLDAAAPPPATPLADPPPPEARLPSSPPLIAALGWNDAYSDSDDSEGVGTRIAPPRLALDDDSDDDSAPPSPPPSPPSGQCRPSIQSGPPNSSRLRYRLQSYLQIFDASSFSQHRAVNQTSDSRSRSAAARQRTAQNAFARAREAAAAEVLIAGRAQLIALSFLYQLRRRVITTPKPFLCCLLKPTSTRQKILKLISSKPNPMKGYSVKYNSTTNQFSFRSSSGVISNRHPAADSPDTEIPAYSGTGSVVKPKWPPRSSSFVLCPEASGAWCYYNVDLGTAVWLSPTDSCDISHTSSSFTTHTFDYPPPPLDMRLSLNSLRDTPWIPLFEDCNHTIKLYNKLTGCTRNGPWISLRTDYGRIYFANLHTRHTSWFPPHTWMRNWLTRQSPFEPNTPLGRMIYPREISRLHVDGGSPYLDSIGTPAYPRDTYDTNQTYPTNSPPGLRC